ncbi:MAG TPA: hypothetical protein VGO37_01540 [Steroidobacteraceae bacterium]|jgi:hypothetical protein|nr:hypothetical protein [Steroidobacteraceae bacterium]
MNRKVLLAAVVGLFAGLAGGCHDHEGSSTPTPPVTQSLDTAQVLALARQTAETHNPLVVNGGALTLNDTSETSAPVAVDAM